MQILDLNISISVFKLEGVSADARKQEKSHKGFGVGEENVRECSKTG